MPNFFMEEGHWFVSVYNDDGDEHSVELIPRNSQVKIILNTLCSYNVTDVHVRIF